MKCCGLSLLQTELHCFLLILRCDCICFSGFVLCSLYSLRQLKLTLLFCSFQYFLVPMLVKCLLKALAISVPSITTLQSHLSWCTSLCFAFYLFFFLQLFPVGLFCSEHHTAHIIFICFTALHFLYFYLLLYFVVIALSIFISLAPNTIVIVHFDYILSTLFINHLNVS